MKDKELEALKHAVKASRKYGYVEMLKIDAIKYLMRRCENAGCSDEEIKTAVEEAYFNDWFY